MARVDTARLAAAADAGRSTVEWPQVMDRLAGANLFVFLLLAAGAFTAFFFGGGWEVDLDPQDTTIPRLINLWIIIAALIVTVMNLRAIAEEMVRTPMLPLLMLLIACSTAWSVNPDYTLRQVIFVFSYSLISVWAGMRFEMGRIIQIHAYSSLLAMVLSVVVAVVPPRIGLHADGTALLRGIYVHKNVLGLALALAAPAFLLGWRHRLLPRWLCVVGFAMVLGMLVWSGSATALGMVALMAMLLVLLSWIDLQRPVAAALVAFAVATVAGLGFVAVMDVQVFFDLLGRDASLTGRTELWALVIGEIEQRPWTGYGYRAFWSLPDHILYARQAFGWNIPHSHSGYLETWLGLGIVGLVLVVLLVLQAIVRGFMALAAGHRLTGEVTIILGIAYIIRNFTEADFAGTTTTWIFALITTVACSRVIRRTDDAVLPHLRRPTANA